MRCIFQLIDNDTGQRSEVMECDRQEFAQRIKDSLQDNVTILVVMEKYDDNWEFSRAPLMSKATYLHFFIEGEPPNEQ